MYSFRLFIVPQVRGANLSQVRDASVFGEHSSSPKGRTTPKRLLGSSAKASARKRRGARANDPLVESSNRIELNRRIALN